MVAGGLLVLVAALRLPAGLRDEPAAVPAVSDELCVGRPCRANADPFPARGYEVPSIAVDPRDRNHEVVADVNLVGARCGWHLTFDGGKSWQDGVFTIPPEFRACHLDSSGLLPMGNVVMGSGEAVYAVLSSARVGEGGPPPDGRRARPSAESVLLVTSTDGGRTFGPAREIVPGGGDRGALLRPAVTVAPAREGVDRLLVTMWSCGQGRCTAGYLSVSDDGGATFAPPALVTPAPGGNSPSQAAVGPDGSIFMTFLRRYDNGQAELLVSRSTDGRTFEATRIDSQNNLGLKYDSAKIAVDPSRGWVYVTYTDTHDGQAQVWFRRSRDRGESFEPAVRLHTSSEGRSFSPALAVAPDGRVEVVFYRQNGRLTNDVQATWSVDGGRTFAPDETLNSRPIDRRIGYWNEVGDWYTPAVAATAGEAFFVWSDTGASTRAGNSQEIFTRRLDRPAP